MNICYVTPDVALPHFRGSSTHVYEVSRNLSSRGHHVTVVSRRLSRSQPTWQAIDGFETYRTFQGLAFEPPRSSYSAAHVDKESFSSMQKLYSWYLRSYRAFQLGAEAATAMSGRRIEVVLERETAFGAGAVLSSFLRVPMVLEMIGPRVSPLSIRRAKRVLAYSEQMAGGKVPRRKLVIVPGGVDTNAFSPDREAGASVRAKHGLGEGFVVGYIGTFQHWHGVNTLLAALKLVNSPRPRVRALLVGPYSADSVRCAEELGVSEDAVFAGPVPYDAVPGYINACDVLCAPYDPSLSKMRREGGIGAPLKVLEYMACGKPAIATSVPPITDVVTDGKNGLLVPPGDAGALAAAVGRVLDDPRLAEALGREGREDVVEKYSWKDLADTIEEALDSATANYPENRESTR